MMMKPINNDSDDEHNTNNHTTNWLGFSLLSPHPHTDTNSRSNHHMKFTSSSSSTTSTTTSDVVPHQQNSQAQLTSGMNVPIGIDLHSIPHQLGFGGGVFGAGGGENVAGVCGPYSSPLSVMPLNSDGSLCLMEALNRSQAQAAMGTDSTAQRLVQAHQYPAFSYNPAYGNLHYPAEDKSSPVLPGSRQFCPAIGYGDLQSLSLSMSTSPQSSCIPSFQHMTNSSPAAAPVECFGIETKKRGHENADGNGHVNGNQKQVVHRKSIDTFGQRTSQYRGVTRHRWTGRYEAHLWDNSCKKEGQSRKGRQVYLGGYDMEEKAARAYDLAALKYWGPSTHINFPLENYHQELGEMKNMSRQEYVAHLRRKSSGFSRGASMYRGVTRHHQHGRWQARIGRVAGNKDLYLGTFGTQEEAAEAYDIAAIKFRGTNAVTNFDITRYDVERIMASNTLLSGDMARRNRDARICDGAFTQENSMSEGLGDIVRLERNSHDARAKELEQLGIGYDPVRSVSDNNTASNGDTEAAAVVDMGKFGIHLSNSPSLVTSVSSSREDSPAERSVALMPFGIAPPNNGLSKLSYGSGTANSSSSWIPTVQIRPDMAVPHMSVFASWTDL